MKKSRFRIGLYLKMSAQPAVRSFLNREKLGRSRSRIVLVILVRISVTRIIRLAARLLPHENVQIY